MYSRDANVTQNLKPGGKKLEQVPASKSGSTSYLHQQVVAIVMGED